ncbi:MAG: FCD domain-containing protein [Desulfobacula sp.]|nr:FCD domain-containing protein [Desulfobacula sp.]
MTSQIDKKIKKDNRMVHPLEGLRDINLIRSFLSNQPRNLLLFDLAVGTGLMMKDLLQLKVNGIRDLKVGDKLPVIDGSKGNPVINKDIYQSLQVFLDKAQPLPDEYLFKSRKGNEPLNVSSVSDMIKSWFKSVDLSGLSGAKSLRKTWELFNKEDRVETKTLAKANKPKVGPLEPVTLQEMAYQELLKAIVAREIEPGQVLVTDELAREMNTSTRTVREALARLAQAGFVMAQKRRGFVVVELTEANLLEILKIRLRLEVMAAEEAALKRSEETMTRLEAIFQRLITVESGEHDDLRELYQINRDFHLTVYAASEMPILIPMITSLWDKWAPYNVIMLRSRFKSTGATERNLAIHGGILKGMKNRDSAMVRRYLERDLNWVIDILIETEPAEISGVESDD